MVWDQWVKNLNTKKCVISFGNRKIENTTANMSGSSDMLTEIVGLQNIHEPSSLKIIAVIYT